MKTGAGNSLRRFRERTRPITLWSFWFVIPLFLRLPFLKRAWRQRALGNPDDRLHCISKTLERFRPFDHLHMWGLHDPIVPLFVQSRCKTLHETANAAKDSLGFILGTLVASMRDIIPPRIFDEHELRSRPREKFLLVLPIRRLVRIIRHIANSLFDPLNNVVPDLTIRRYSEAISKDAKADLQHCMR